MKFKNKKISIISFCFAFIICIGFLIYSSYSIYKSSGVGSKRFSVAAFDVKLNDSSNLNQTIDLKDTITDNNYSSNYVMPGTNGNIVLSLDFSGVEVSCKYNIKLGSYSLPSNLKFYSDANYTNEFSSINGYYNLGSDSTIIHNIYWKWDYKTDNNSNNDDNSFMNTELLVPIKVDVTQRLVGEN